MTSHEVHGYGRMHIDTKATIVKAQWPTDKNQQILTMVLNVYVWHSPTKPLITRLLLTNEPTKYIQQN